MRPYGTHTTIGATTATVGRSMTVGKILAGVVMGAPAALLTGFNATFLFGPDEVGLLPVGGFLVVLALALTAGGTARAWGRGMLACGLLSVLLPLSGLAFGSSMGSPAFAILPTIVGLAGAVAFLIPAFLLMRRGPGR